MAKTAKRKEKELQQNRQRQKMKNKSTNTFLIANSAGNAMFDFFLKAIKGSPNRHYKNSAKNKTTCTTHLMLYKNILKGETFLNFT